MVMARKARGSEVLGRALEMLPKASGADELRRLLAVVLPLAHGMSTAETARVVGRGTTWVTAARNRFIRSGGEPEGKPAGTRNKALLARAEEAAFLEPFVEGARNGGVLVVGRIHEALEARLGRRVARAPAYNILHRHGWRKLAPDKRHVSADPAAQEDWKKNSGRASGGSRKAGKGRGRSG
jgi:transposase